MTAVVCSQSNALPGTGGAEKRGPFFTSAIFEGGRLFEGKKLASFCASDAGGAMLPPHMLRPVDLMGMKCSDMCKLDTILSAYSHFNMWSIMYAACPESIDAFANC